MFKFHIKIYNKKNINIDIKNTNIIKPKNLSHPNLVK